MDIATTLLEYGAKCDAESRVSISLFRSLFHSLFSLSPSLPLSFSLSLSLSISLYLCLPYSLSLSLSLSLPLSLSHPLSLPPLLPLSPLQSGFTPLHLASQEGHTDMVSLLLQRGASVNCKAKVGCLFPHSHTPYTTHHTTPYYNNQ